MAKNEAASSDSDVVMLMVKTNDISTDEKSSWYLDSECSIHMTSRRDWFIKIDDISHGKIRFADDSSLNSEGVGRVVLRDSDDREVVIDDVLYVSGLKTNQLSLGQLL